MAQASPPVVVVMGVAGVGKTTVARLLAQRLDAPYAEGDDFHPEANIAKMAAGIPLDDTDREPWLTAHRRMDLRAWTRGDRRRSHLLRAQTSLPRHSAYRVV